MSPLPDSTGPNPAVAPTHSLPLLSLPLAQHALASALAHASTLPSSPHVNISIYDATLHLLAFARMPGAKLTSVDIAHNKALTAAGHRAPTDAYGARAEPGGALYGVQNSNGGRFCTIRGGEPVLLGGVCVGGVGVSGGTPDEDKEIALAGVKRIQELAAEYERAPRSML